MDENYTAYFMYPDLILVCKFGQVHCKGLALNFKNICFFFFFFSEKSASATAQEITGMYIGTILQWALHHTVPSIEDLLDRSLLKTMWKRRKYWQRAFSPFPTMFPTLPKDHIAVSSLSHSPKCWRPIRNKPFENNVGKEEMLETTIFSFSHNVSYFSKGLYCSELFITLSQVLKTH